MGQFNLHFFKEKNREIDLESLISFFNSQRTFKIEMNDLHAKFTYTHPTLGSKANFIITPKSQVPNIYRLNPRYLDLNFRLEFPILTPDYIARDIFMIVKKICDRYDFFVYSEFFEDVLAFKTDIVTKVFGMIKHAFIERNPDILLTKKQIQTEKLSAILRYTADLYELQDYYRDKDTHVPIYQFYHNKNDVLLSIEWYDGNLIVYPPYLDYIVFHSGKSIKTYKYQDIYPLISKYLDDVPGFIKGTKVVQKKNLKKITKVFKKYQENAVINNFQRLSITDLID